MEYEFPGYITSTHCYRNAYKISVSLMQEFRQNTGLKDGRAGQKHYTPRYIVAWRITI